VTSARETCATCGAALPPAFPGGVVSCTCGARIAVPPLAAPLLKPAPGREPATSGPYRGGAAGAGAPVVVTECPYCSNAIDPLAPACPHCDVRLETMRCSRCYSLHAPGAFACARCGQPLPLEPLVDATDAPCPRCAEPLRAASGEDVRVHECRQCGGIFVPRASLARMLESAARSGETGDASDDAARPLRARSVEEVRYLACPLCHGSMNRVSFGKVAAVVADVCHAHGTWFDAGELTRVVAFASAGTFDE